MQVKCEDCGKTIYYTPEVWRCECGGAWLVEESLTPHPEHIHPTVPSLWRYAAFFPMELQQMKATLGAGCTPLLPCTFHDRKVSLKLDSMMPTGSFKDRGVELMLNYLAGTGVREIVEDSSGNAGASVAAYAARLGMQASIFAPAHASPAKLAQIACFGADIHRIPGPRANASRAVLDAVAGGLVYASHAYNPVYLLGQQTAAWEVWEQLGFRAPDWVVMPVGQGGNLLGYYEGFKTLQKHGLIEKIPGMIAVQPKRLAPICEAFENAWQDWKFTDPSAEPSVAEGLAITKPVRWRHIMKAIADSGGFCVSVEEESILPARNDLAGHGFFVEPTSAVVIAALQQIINIIEKDQSVVISLTGSGLKSVVP